jgi:hypothetical protein
MSEKKVSLILEHMAEKIAPSDEINLWPKLQTRFQTSAPVHQTGAKMNTQKNNSNRLRFAAIAFAVLVIFISVFLMMPQGKALAQTVFQFFTRAESDTLPVQAFQLTPLPADPTPDPGDINNAVLSVSEVAQLAGFDVLEPTWIPAELSFVGATYDQEYHTARIFYRYGEETNGLVVREEPFDQTDDCELCGKVGQGADIQPVQINVNLGEYVEGFWSLTENGPEWVSDPYLKTMRWQANGMAFELLYMGPPESITIDDLTMIAESIKD